MTIPTSHSFAQKLYQLLHESARWTLWGSDGLTHINGYKVSCTPYWSQFHELDPEPPELTIHTKEGVRVVVQLAAPFVPTPSRWADALFGTSSAHPPFNPAHPFVIAFNRRLETCQQAALATAL